MDEHDIQPHAFYEATIRIRTDRHMPPVRPEAAKHNGKRLVFHAAWPLEGEDERPHYIGEWAMVPEMHLAGLTWIASGDLADVTRTYPND